MGRTASGEPRHVKVPSPGLDGCIRRSHQDLAPLFSLLFYLCRDLAKEPSRALAAGGGEEYSN